MCHKIIGIVFINISDDYGFVLHLVNLTERICSQCSAEDHNNIQNCIVDPMVKIIKN
jgi:hypothetical protein